MASNNENGIGHLRALVPWLMMTMMMMMMMMFPLWIIIPYCLQQPILFPCTTIVNTTTTTTTTTTIPTSTTFTTLLLLFPLALQLPLLKPQLLFSFLDGRQISIHSVFSTYLGTLLEILDIDECELLIADCDQICSNTPGSYQCSCVEGYQLVVDHNTCIPICKYSLSMNSRGYGWGSICKIVCTCGSFFIFKHRCKKS